MSRSVQSRVWLFFLLVPALARAQEIGFEERFALADDRAAVLAELIPGTDDYYYYSCLHAQQTGDLDAVDAMLTTWEERQGQSARFETIRHRQALLMSDGSSFQFVRRELGLDFPHRQQLDEVSLDLPTALDPALLATDRLVDLALRRHRGELEGFTDSGLWLLANRTLGLDARRQLLDRLELPDYPGLPGRVVAELREKLSRPFGALEIHSRLTRDQLEACVALMPELLQQRSFVEVYVPRLAPSSDVDLRRDTAAREAYVDRLVAFSRRLGPAFGALKAHALYQRLQLDRELGRHDRAKFLEYIQLPRVRDYMLPEYLQSPGIRDRRIAAPVSDPQAGLLQPVWDDWSLVEDYLLHFFVDDGDYGAYASYIREDVLRRVFVEAKVLSGTGDLERWYSMLDDPAAYERLKERVDLTFAATNRRYFGARDRVTLDLDLKNVPTLLVKVFQINALNYYRELGHEIDTTITLDGLVANHEKTFQYDAPSWRRVRRSFELPELDAPGVYVVEFIGGGRGSRAIVQKGRLRYSERVGAAGHVFTVRDEQGEPVPDARLWLSGHEFLPDSSGEIVVPFTREPGPQRIVLGRGDGPATQATLDTFQHQAEEYSLEVGFHLERESVIAGESARLLVRPRLTLHGKPVSLELLEDVALMLHAIDLDGTSTRQVIRDFELFETRESIHELRVPERLARLEVALSGRVDNLGTGEKDELSDAWSWNFNGIDEGDGIENLLLTPSRAGYVLEVRGKTGEPRPGRPVAVSLELEDFEEPVVAELQTDASGRIQLGVLEGVRGLEATVNDGLEARWELPRSSAGPLPGVLQGVVGEVLRLPCVLPDRRPRGGDATAIDPREFALFEVGPVDDCYVADRGDHLTRRGGYLELSGLPAGEYQLDLKRVEHRVRVHVADAVRRDDQLLGASWTLEASPTEPLTIASVSLADDAVIVGLGGAGATTRVHVTASRYLAAPMDATLALEIDDPGRRREPAPASAYLTGRDLGDEYRYILDRRREPRYPGNMLERPGLLLNPWAVRDTETGRRDAAAGEDWGETFYGAERPGRTNKGGGILNLGDDEGSSRAPSFANVDFLPEPAVVLTNLVPGAYGTVRIDRRLLGGHSFVRVVAVDDRATIARTVLLDELPLKPRDLTLKRGLDPARHFTEQKRTTARTAGSELVIDSFASASLEAYDTLADVYGFFATSGGTGALEEFEFVTRWPSLDPKEKQRLYSRYACHELSFFLSRKDPVFFAEVIAPYLASKKEKTFMDRYLLGEDLQGYLDPWAYGRLNTLEQILLAGRVPGEAAATARHIGERCDLIPRNLEEWNGRFEMAIRGRSLEVGATFESLRREAGEAEDEASAYGEPAEDAKKEKALRARPPAAAKVAEEKSSRDRGLAGRRSDVERRKQVRSFYRPIARTREYAENDYYHVTLAGETPELVPPGEFWDDYARHVSTGTGPFLSAGFIETTHSLTEMLCALAVLDLPFEAKEHGTDLTDGTLTLKPSSSLIAFHREVRPSREAEATPILVSQNFFRKDDRSTFEGRQRRDKFVTDEFIAHVVYGCQSVVTNPTSSPQTLDVLVQIPRGAMPVQGGMPTRGLYLEVEPYSTHQAEYHFYFPAADEFAHFPAHVARNGALLNAVEPVRLTVVETPTRVDTGSWQHISQRGTPEEVLTFLESTNLERLDLTRVAWRLRDRPDYLSFGRSLLDLLRRRHVYSDTLWSYGIRHEDETVAREFLRHQNDFLARCGSWLETPLVSIDPREQEWYQHLEYSPLVNARAHALGGKPAIDNRAFAAQYRRFLDQLSLKPALAGSDRLAMVQYLFLQDRVAEAIAQLDRIPRPEVGEKIQYDYLRAYAAFYTDEPQAARPLARQYRDHPVDRWRARFLEVERQLDEAEGRATDEPQPGDDDSRTTDIAATDPTFDLQVEARQVAIEYRNLNRCHVNYYPMDVELLFSSQPFVRSAAGDGLEQWAAIQPLRSDTVELPTGADVVNFDLPEEFHARNVIVEVTAGGQRKSRAYYANTMALQVIERYGQVKVTSTRSRTPLVRTYVKVYAHMEDGSTRFYKDGYTDLRGRFDYTALSTDDLGGVDRFALLVLDDEQGAIIREVEPPKQ